MSKVPSSELWHIVNQIHHEVQFKGAGLKFLASIISRAERILKDVDIEVAEYWYSPKRCNCLKSIQWILTESVEQNGTFRHSHVVPGLNHYWTFCIVKIQIWN